MVTADPQDLPADASDDRARRLRAPVALAALLMAIAALVFALTRPTPTPRKAIRADIAATVKSGLDKSAKDAASAPARSAKVYQAIAPSIVLIKVTGARAANEAPPSTAPAAASSTVASDDAQDVARDAALGAGVIVNADGIILTANHVVDGADSITVTFADGTTSKGEIVSQQSDRDIAVLRTDRLPEVVVAAVLGGGARVGDEAFAVGHPLGLYQSMSAGVISGLDRSIPVKDGATLDGLIQFDAAVNPGNSGGPLLNRNGQVIGIVTGLANPAQKDFFVGIGFAVPIESVGGAGAGPPR